MGFRDLFRPTWKHSDTETRLRAVRALDPADDRVLIEVIRTDEDEHIRRVALKKLDDPRRLLELGKQLEPAALREAAVERATELLLAEALAERAPAGPLAALALLENEREIASVARRAQLAEVRRAAVARLGDTRLLVDLALRAEDDEIRTAALARLSGEAAMIEIATSSDDKRIALAALARVMTTAALAGIAKDARNKTVRTAARERVPGHVESTAEVSTAKIKSAGTPTDKVRKAQQLALCMAAENAARHDAPTADMDDLHKQWSDVDGHSAKKDLADRFAAAFALHAQRAKAHQEEERRRLHAKEVAVAKAQAKAAATREAAAKEAAAAETAEAARVAREAAAAAAAAAALPPPPPELTAEERMTAMCVEAERGLRNPERAASLEASFRAADPGGELETLVALRQRFAAAVEAAATRRREAEERTRAEHASVVAGLEGAARDLEAATAGDRRQALDRAIKDSRALVGKIGKAGSAEIDALRQHVIAAQDKAADRLAELSEAENWKRWANIPKLETLCQEAEALAEVVTTVEDQRRVPAVMAELRQRWKDAGVPASDRQKALWERFKKAGDLVHERTREYFAKLDGEHAGAAARKEELCVKVEALVESTEWKETTEKIVAVQLEWKTAGHVPGEKGEALWTRFRAACDKFFARRDESDKTLDAEREANLGRAEAICAQIEALSTSTEWRQTAETIKSLQRDWQAVSALPRGKGGPLWKRFRAACDAFFDARKAAFAAEDALRAENLAKKQALCVRAEAVAAALPKELTAAQRDAVLPQIDALRAEWREIGHVPREEQDAVTRRFRTACDAVLPPPPPPVVAAPSASSTPAPGKSSSAPAAPTPAPSASGVSGFSNRLPLGKILDKLSPK